MTNVTGPAANQLRRFVRCEFDTAVDMVIDLQIDWVIRILRRLIWLSIYHDAPEHLLIAVC